MATASAVFILWANTWTGHCITNNIKLYLFQYIKDPTKGFIIWIKKIFESINRLIYIVF